MIILNSPSRPAPPPFLPSRKTHHPKGRDSLQLLPDSLQRQCQLLLILALTSSVMTSSILSRARAFAFLRTTHISPCLPVFLRHSLLGRPPANVNIGKQCSSFKGVFSAMLDFLKCALRKSGDRTPRCLQQWRPALGIPNKLCFPAIKERWTLRRQRENMCAQAKSNAIVVRSTFRFSRWETGSAWPVTVVKKTTVSYHSSRLNRTGNIVSEW